MMVQCINNIIGKLSSLARNIADGDKKPARVPKLTTIHLIGEAWISIGANRMRTLLAMLGIVIGVAAVVLMIAIGAGSQKRVEKSISALGNNVLIVTLTKKNLPGFTKKIEFSKSDIDTISSIHNVEAVAYSTAIMQKKFYTQNLQTDSVVSGITTDYLYIRNWQIENGSAFTDDEIRFSGRVIILGKSIAARLFGDGDPVGRSISIGEAKIPFRVIGVLETKGAGLNGEDMDNVTYVPPTTFKTYFGNSYDSEIQIITVKSRSGEVMDELSEEVQHSLRQLHKIPDAIEDGFKIYNVNSIKKLASETTKAFSILLGAIASISLIVGGIGIMNIMLVTVSERTKEIGIRKAIGATDKQILKQFLLEAIIISGVGSILGLLIGYISGFVVEQWFSVSIEFSIYSVLLALFMSIGIGLPSGLYPAYKASKMQPIEALRSVGA
jgi:putative ABC transport system permease protein